MSLKQIILNKTTEDILVCYLNTSQKSKEEFIDSFKRDGLKAITELPIFIVLCYIINPGCRSSYNIHGHPSNWISLTVYPETLEVEDTIIYNYDSLHLCPMLMNIFHNHN